MILLTLSIIVLLVLNVLMMIRLLNSRESRSRKVLFSVGIWILPFFGALLVLLGVSPPGVSPYPIRDPKTPGDI